MIHAILHMQAHGMDTVGKWTVAICGTIAIAAGTWFFKGFEAGGRYDRWREEEQQR